jgi:hypothetical protein
LVLFVVGLIWWDEFLDVGQNLQEILKLKKKEEEEATYVTQKKKVLGGLPATPRVAGVAVRHPTWPTKRR